MKKETQSNLKKALVKVLFIVVFTMIPMFITQFIQDVEINFKVYVITVISQLIVGVPLLFLIEKKYSKQDQANDKISI